MCGRYTLTASPEAVRDALALDLDQEPLFSARYNVAPTQPVAAVRQEQDGRRQLSFLRWGLIPSWASEPSIGNRLINARSEPYLFRLIDGRPFGFAGLWERWHGPDEGAVETWTILTTSANELLQPVHDRRPVILATADYSRWLDARVKPAEVMPLLRSFAAEAMTSWPVSTPLTVVVPTHTPEAIPPFGELA